MLCGMGFAGRAEVIGSSKGLQVTLGAHHPWFLKTAWNMDLPLSWLYREEPSYTIEKKKLRLRLARSLAKKLTLGGLYRFELSDVDKLRISANLTEEEDLVLGALGPFLEYNTYEISIPGLKYSDMAPPGKTGLVVSLLAEHELFARIHEDGWLEEFTARLEQRILEVLTKYMKITLPKKKQRIGVIC